MHLDGICVSPTRWRNSDAYRLTARRLELTIVTRGGHIASISEPGDTLNPLWQPPWPAADPSSVDPTRDGPYGIGSEAPTLASIVGHNLCLDRFGPPWPGEDRPTHGEAGVSTWKLARAENEQVVFETSLPLADLAVQRRVLVSNRTCRIETRARVGGGERRMIDWAEHPSVGEPFLGGAAFSAGIDVAYEWPADDGDRSPMAPEVASVLDFPAPDAPARGDVFAGRVRDGFWQAHHAKIHRTLTYRWDPKQFPWLVIWTEHRSRSSAPWRGQTRVRGMELSSRPFPEGFPPLARRERFDGHPASLFVSPGDEIVRWFEVTWD